MFLNSNIRSIILIAAIFCCFRSMACFGQTGDQSYGKPKSYYVPKSTNALTDYAIELNRRYSANYSRFSEFYEGKLKSLDSDKNSLAYRSQVFALNKFIDRMQPYIDNGNWEDAAVAIGNATTSYYEDLAFYPEFERKKNAEKLTTIETLNANGMKHFSSGNYTKALESFEKSQEVLNNPYGLYGICISQYQLGKTNEAFQAANQITYSFPNHVIGYKAKGDLYHKANLPAMAIESYNMALSLDTSNKEILNTRAWLYIEMAKFDLAFIDFEKLIRLSPFEALGYFGRSYVYSQKKKQELALSDLKKVIEIEPEHSMALNNLGWLFYEKKQYEVALDYLNKAILFNDKNYVAYDSRGEVYFTIKMYKQAIDDCSKSIELNVSQSNAYLIRGRSRYRINDKNGACDDWNLAKSLNNDKALYYVTNYCQ